ncbi:MAG: nuclear transport factor 2 family protein [bacterium]
MSPEHRAQRAAQRQLDAYNTGDIDAFVACYHPDVRIFDLKTGEQTMSGREEMHNAYGPMFQKFPELNAVVTTRSVVGNVVFDREFVTGRGEPIQVMAIYEVDEHELITKVWFVR